MSHGQGLVDVFSVDASSKTVGILVGTLNDVIEVLELDAHLHWAEDLQPASGNQTYYIVK